MKNPFFILFSVMILFANHSLAADRVCKALPEDLFIAELQKLSHEHASMTKAEILADFQLGADFIDQSLGSDSAQAKMARRFLVEVESMEVEEIQFTEALRIGIIPVMGPKDIYRENQGLLLRNCREILLAALILT